MFAVNFTISFCHLNALMLEQFCRLALQKTIDTHYLKQIADNNLKSVIWHWYSTLYLYVIAKKTKIWLTGWLVGLALWQGLLIDLVQLLIYQTAVLLEAVSWQDAPKGLFHAISSRGNPLLDILASVIATAIF